MKMCPYIVYVKVDDSGYITAVNSSAFMTDITGWTEIDSGFGDKFHHAQGNYFPKSIIDERGIYRYKLVDGIAVERTAEEMSADAWEQETAEKQLTPEQEIAELKAVLNRLLEGLTQ